MAKKDESEWDELKIVHKRVAKVRATYGSLKFELSGKAEKEWSDALCAEIDSDDEAADMQRNPGASVDGDVITWEVFHDDIEVAWRVLKRAIDVANEKYSRILQVRAAREAELQDRLSAREKMHKELENRLQALK